LVEQNIHMALKICNKAYVMKTGGIVLSGSGKDLLANEDVRKAYIGERGSRL
jgi:branched-chain amino acid transport system ATP-binding protein